MQVGRAVQALQQHDTRLEVVPEVHVIRRAHVLNAANDLRHVDVATVDFADAIEDVREVVSCLHALPVAGEAALIVWCMNTKSYCSSERMSFHASAGSFANGRNIASEPFTS